MLASKVICTLEAADLKNKTDHVTNAYLATSVYYLDKKERYCHAIWE